MYIIPKLCQPFRYNIKKGVRVLKRAKKDKSLDGLFKELKKQTTIKIKRK